MNKVICAGTLAKDCMECGKYFSAHSSHYDSYYDCHVIEFTCCTGGHRIFKDEDGDKHRIK